MKNPHGLTNRLRAFARSPAARRAVAIIAGAVVLSILIEVFLVEPPSCGATTDLECDARSLHETLKGGAK